MTLDELDRLAGIHVMGFEEDSDWLSFPGLWQPTRDISQAWECLEKVGSKDFFIKKQGSLWLACFVSADVVAAREIASEAIVRACLRLLAASDA